MKGLMLVMSKAGKASSSSSDEDEEEASSAKELPNEEEDSIGSGYANEMRGALEDTLGKKMSDDNWETFLQALHGYIRQCGPEEEE